MTSTHKGGNGGIIIESQKGKKDKVKANKQLWLQKISNKDHML